VSEPPARATPDPAAGQAAPPSRPQAAGHGAPAPRPHAAGHPIPHWLFPLAMLVVLEPPVLIALWFANNDLANGHLVAIALIGGLFISLPSLAIFGLAVMWDRRLASGGTVPGLPPAMTGARASRISAIALAASTVAIAAVLALLLGAWALIALPPLALSLASAWLMARAA
jgi:hypothetical protein